MADVRRRLGDTAREGNPADSTKHLPADISERHGVALCLSGGGYRAALFHLGALRRLDELGVLPKVTTISSVSGGSIVNAMLATRLRPWPDAAGAPSFGRLAEDLRDLTQRNIRAIPSFRRVERHYRQLIGSELLGELPDDGPSFVFCATDMANAVNWTFGRGLRLHARLDQWEAGSYRAGYAPADRLPLVRAVAASSSFPPVLGPVPLPFDEADYKDGKRGITSNVRLTDGGVYDNLGLEPVWKSHRTLLVSDGGATLDLQPYTPLKPWHRYARYVSVANSQGGSIRKRWLVANYTSNRDDGRSYDGAYFGLGSEVAGYKVKGKSLYPQDLIDDSISEVRTDLDAFSDAEAGILQNHGYVMCDAAVRTWCPKLANPQHPPPHPPFAELMDAGLAARELELRKSNKRRLPFGRFR